LRDYHTQLRDHRRNGASALVVSIKIKTIVKSLSRTYWIEFEAIIAQASVHGELIVLSLAGIISISIGLIVTISSVFLHICSEMRAGSNYGNDDDERERVVTIFLAVKSSVKRE
jgi:hypothetical protein